MGVRPQAESNRSIKRYKVRVVAKGYSQIGGIDFDELFAPVAEWASMHTLSALATARKVSKLNRAIPGIRQASRSPYNKFEQALLELNFQALRVRQQHLHVGL